MAIKLPNGNYACGYCFLEYSDPVKADTCKSNHDLIYIALSRADLNALLHFIYLKDESLLTTTLMNNLQKYLKGNRI